MSERQDTTSEGFRLLGELPSAEEEPPPPTEQPGSSPADSTQRSPFRNLVLLTPSGKILYRDKEIIRQVYDAISAEAIQHANPIAGSQIIASSQVSELLESLDWSPRSDTNFDYLILLLSSVMRDKKSVADLVCEINRNRERNAYLNSTDSIYPGMPVWVVGLVGEEKDVHEREICLRTGEFSIRVVLNLKSSLRHDASFLANRLVFALGIVRSIDEEVFVDAGALLL